MFDRDLDVDELEVALAESYAVIERLTAECERYRQALMKRADAAEG